MPLTLFLRPCFSIEVGCLRSPPTTNLVQLNCGIPVISVDSSPSGKVYEHSQGIEPILTKKKDDYHNVVSRRIAMLRYDVKNPTSKTLV